MSPNGSSARFVSPTQDFDLDLLVSQLRKGFLVSVGIAAALHLLVAAINPFATIEQKAPRPLTTRFVKREPRLTKPLELRKIPQPMRQLARRKVKLARARMDQVQATARFNTHSLIASHIGGSGISLGTQTHFNTMRAMHLEPKLAAAAVTSTRDSEHKIDMALEMLGIDAMDTGRYKAIVIQDAGDKQSIKGFVKFAQVMSTRALTLQPAGGGNVDFLRDLLNEYTGLKADFLGHLTYDDPRLHEIPLLFSPRGSWEHRALRPNETELANLAQYLMAGGFIFFETPNRTTAETLIPYSEALEKYGGLVQGKDYWVERLPEDHIIFHAFFDLRGGMPNNSHTAEGKSGLLPWNYAIGHFIKGRMVGLATNTWQWNSPGGLRLAVNVVIYVVTQEGSITQRLMQIIN